MSLPVTIEEVHGGLSNASGTLYLTDDFLVLSVQVAFLSMWKQKPLTVKIAPEALHSVRYKRGLFKDKMFVRPWKPALLDAVPGKHEGEIALQVKKSFRHEAEALVEEVDYWLRRSETP